MIKDIIYIIIIVGLLFFLVFYLKKYRSWWSMRGISYQPKDKNFTKLLSEIPRLSLEHKVMIIQSCTDQRTNILLSAGRSDVLIMGASVSEADVEKLEELDRAIG